jgi:hypothetical protein
LTEKSVEERLRELDAAVASIRANLIPSKHRSWEDDRDDYERLWDELIAYKDTLRRIAARPAGCTTTANLSIKDAQEVLEEWE